MAQITFHLNDLPRTPSSSPQISTGATAQIRREADSRKRSKFFDAYDRGRAQWPPKAPDEIFEEQHVKPRTGRYWLQQRRVLGSPAERRTRKLAARLGRKEILSSSQTKWLTTIANKVRDNVLETQIEHHKLNVHVTTLQRSLKRHTNNAKMHKKPRVKEISKKNKGERVDYDWEHEHHIIHNYWQYVWFSDESHIDPTTTPDQRVLCEEGTRLESENLQEMPGESGVTVHVEAMVNWHKKGKLRFYNCSNDSPDAEVKKERKPRRRPTKETTEEYEQRVRDWKARQPHDSTIKASGNSMTQQYYRDELLPHIVDEIKAFEREFGRAILQEDNDSSHGTRSNKAKSTPNVCEQYRIDHNVETLKHPAQSPDLNCQEGAWNIFMARVRRHPRPLGTKRELMDICLKVWDEIDQKEIQARISEMPERCKALRSNGDMGMKSYLW